MARAFKADGATSSSVERASRIHETHGERDSHRLFKRFGLSLPVPISQLEFAGESGTASVPFLKASDYFSYLMRRCPELLLGGHKRGQEAQDLCRKFWQGYQTFHPEHKAFTRFSSEELGRVVPIALHGDKGRGYLKLPMFCFSFESVFGLPKELRQRSARAGDRTRQEHGGKLQWSCGQRAREQLTPEVDFDGGSCPKRRKLNSGEAMPHNGTGHVFMSRFLGAAIPSKTFKQHPGLVPRYLQELQEDLTGLFQDGCLCREDSQVYYASVIGVKGDFEYHLEVAGYNRSYMNIGSINDRAFCPECFAGREGVPSIDLQDSPSWLQSLHADEPWDSLPELSKIPFGDTKRATLYRRDAFHTLKYGFLKDLCAGCVMYLAQLKYFDSVGDSCAVDNRLARAYGHFKLYCLAAGKSTTIRKFSLRTFHRSKATKHPFIGGKGADSVVFMQWLELLLKLKIANPLDPTHVELLCAMLETIQGGLAYVGVFHTHPLFFPRGCAKFLLKSGLRLLRGNCYLASRCISEGRRFFALRPKVHYYHHFLTDLQYELSKGHSSIFNYAAAFNCEANEDWIGRVCRISRRVSAKLNAQRTIDRYLVACRLIFKRALL